MDIGERIKMIRQKSGMTQTQLSKKLNVSQSAIAEWESEKRLPTIDTVVEISDLFSVSCDWLLTGTKTEHIDTVKEFGFRNDTIEYFKKNKDDLQLFGSLECLIDTGNIDLVKDISYFLKRQKTNGKLTLFIGTESEEDESYINENCDDDMFSAVLLQQITTKLIKARERIGDQE